MKTGFACLISNYLICLMIISFIDLDKLYGSNSEVWERHRHRYEVNPEKVPQLEKAGMKFVGKDEKGERMEILELEGLSICYILPGCLVYWGCQQAI